MLCALAALTTARARRYHQRVAVGAVLGVMMGLAACTQDQSEGTAVDLMPPTDSSTAIDGDLSSHVTCSAFVVNGSPTATQGASWTYQATDDGVAYMLTGTLLQPAGAGPFPGVLISHGFGGSASGYSRSIALAMRDWGVVGIATNYTHSVTPDGLPTGAFGASDANILRAHKTWQLLSCLPQVNSARIAAHGHSMGALITGQLLGLYPTEFIVASHSAGGVSDTGIVNDGVLTTTASVAAAIKTPYQLHHGDQDSVVPLAMDMRLDAILTAAGTKHELNIYAGYTHPQIALDTTMLNRVRAWYLANGLF